ncbi:MAG: putative actin patch assembly and actin polymerization protein [Caeruleum heppii]|nr:MAG: putative actin patch assembly and actin polymerization protein [Caeruleum heppii]
MFGAQKKPYTAVTVQIEQLTSEAIEENDLSGIVDLIEVIRLQSSGPVEAARALRKKLKYGSVHMQLRALTILDGLMQNAGSRFQRAFADEPLLERLRIAATDPVSDPEVKGKCKLLFGQWSVAYSKTPGMERISSLYKQLPQRKKPRTQQQSKVLRETEAEAELDGRERSSSTTSPTTPSSSSFRTAPLSSVSNTSAQTKKSKLRSKPFNLEKEKPQLMESLASASVASTNLMNALKLINRENKRVSEDAEVLKRFETCKVLRRQILRYIQYVESEQWLGSLIHANEELVNALMAFEILDKSVDVDSDSDEDEWDDDSASKMAIKSPGGGDATDTFAGLTLGDKSENAVPAKPPRPGMSMAMPPKPSFSATKGKYAQESPKEEPDDQDDDDEDDPFADRNAVSTPHMERPGMTW